MPYFSRLILNLWNLQVQRDLSNLQLLRDTLLNGFDASPAGHNPRRYHGLLYRVEPIRGDQDNARLLVQSLHRPNWHHLSKTYLGTSHDVYGNCITCDLSKIYQSLKQDCIYRFRLRACPTMRIHKGIEERNNYRGQRVNLQSEGECAIWLARQGRIHGFQLLPELYDPQRCDISIDLCTTPPIEQYGFRSVVPSRILNDVLFQGRLRVIDITKFRQMLLKGIGSAKSYGFGLMTVCENF